MEIEPIFRYNDLRDLWKENKNNHLRILIDVMNYY